MKIIDFDQGQRSDLWHDWRSNGIGASDISVLMGTNPYKTPQVLFDEKNGHNSKPFLNAAIKHGVEFEPVALEWINIDEGLNLKPLCIEDIEHSYFKASLDGFDTEKKVLCEIKCPTSEKILKNVRENKIVPEYWLSQVQWQIMLCKPTRAFLAVWDPDAKECIKIEVFALPKVQEEMREKAQEFWRQVQLGIVPKPTEKDFLVIDDSETKNLFKEYNEQDKIEKAASYRKKLLKDKILQIGNGKNFYCGQFSVVKVSPRISYNIDQMQVDGIDIERYAKKSGNGFFKISRKR